MFSMLLQSGILGKQLHDYGDMVVKCINWSECLRLQTTEFMARYASDASAREEYNRLWDATVGFKRPAATANEVTHRPLNLKSVSTMRSKAQWR